MVNFPDREASKVTVTLPEVFIERLADEYPQALSEAEAVRAAASEGLSRRQSRE